MITALHFSGGKDSLACLYLYRDRWDEILVCWVNTGAAYPEVVESMNRWKERLPHFLEIKSDQPAQIARNGYPTDVLPLRYTYVGKQVFREAGTKLQGYFNCCGENLWLPMQREMRERGIKRIIRGQRKEDRRSSPIRSGYVDQDGVEYVFPVEDWSREQVMEYLRSVDAEIPPYYDTELTSRDCWDCTAYLDENMERIHNMPTHMKTVVLGRLAEMRFAISAEAGPLFALSEAR